MTKAKMTSSTIRTAMAKRWAAPQWAIMWEVADGTGARARRRADAVMMSLWPSAGLELHGVEIKISKSDWKREAKDPTKSEAIAQYCDRWWIHTPPGIVTDLSELPPAWGLREFSGRQWKTVKEAGKTEAVPVSRDFLAALLRRADGDMQKMLQEAMQNAQQATFEDAEKRRQQNQKLIESQVKMALENYKAGRERRDSRIEEFEAAFGDGIHRGWGKDFSALGAAALKLHECRPGAPGNAAHLVQKLRDAADAIEQIDEFFPKKEVM